jgi:hypothetical protein
MQWGFLRGPWGLPLLIFIQSLLHSDPCEHYHYLNFYLKRLFRDWPRTPFSSKAHSLLGPIDRDSPYLLSGSKRVHLFPEDRYRAQFPKRCIKYKPRPSLSFLLPSGIHSRTCIGCMLSDILWIVIVSFPYRTGFFKPICFLERSYMEFCLCQILLTLPKFLSK